MNKIGLNMATAFLWVVIYFGVMLIYTFLDVYIWRKIVPEYSHYLNIISIIASVIGFIIFLCNKTGYLGILFIKTDSILSCMLAHCGYNLISFAIMIMTYITCIIFIMI